MVPLSQFRDPATIRETFSPTASPTTVFAVTQLTASEPTHILAAYDRTTAFLRTPIPDHLIYYIRITSDVVKFWLERCPQRATYVSSDGCLYFRVHRFIYGLHEAPREWNQMLHKDLLSLGFVASDADPKQEDEGSTSGRGEPTDVTRRP
jgi:hypothetical protein